MYTTEIRTETEEFLCHHNGDYSGDIHIVLDPERLTNYMGRSVVQLPFEVMQELVGNWIQQRRIAALEELSGKEIVKVETERG